MDVKSDLGVEADSGSELKRIRSAAERFVSAMRAVNPAAPSAYMRVGGLMREIAGAIADAEPALGKAGVLSELTEVRSVIAQGPFAERIKKWPSGYAGDFDTVSWIVQQQDRSVPNTIDALIDRHCLGCAICQQHRNKIKFQSRLIVECAEREDLQGPANILLIAAGSALDLQDAMLVRSVRQSRYCLNDYDPLALQAAVDGLAELNSDQIALVPGNAFAVAGEIAKQGPFDLILMGGLFDYLSDRAARLLLRAAFSKWLAPGGTVYFSNIATGNPYRHWMEYLEDWTLIERSESDLRALFDGTGMTGEQIQLQRDTSGLSWLVVARA